ncbi:MAG: cupin domain-containing protein [Chloroflexi bacterium]|nr:cupin domain-containing protein [Chloroflexota bacterium]
MKVEPIPPNAGYIQKTPYEIWMEKEGIPVVTGYSVGDLREVPVKPWPRRGGLGAFINLRGSEQSAGSYVCEIPPGGSLEPQKHLYEETVLILNGRGATTIWYEGCPKQTFEWGEGSLFAIPLNAWYQHFNGQGDKPVRFFGVNSAPLVMNLFHNTDFVFNNGYVFKDRYNGEEEYFSSKGKLLINKRRRVWESNFIPDLLNIKLYEYQERGAGGTYIDFELADNTMCAHTAEFPSGTYKKAHRHGPAANVVILAGKGYSLMWPEGESWVKCDWHPGSLVIPPDRWFHQHFNTGTEPARYLAMRWNSQKHSMGLKFRQDESTKSGGDQIEYEDEDPAVMKLFKQELAKEGAQLHMSHPYA